MMPENEKDMQNESNETARDKFERERMTRRAALKKLGVTTAMSVFALFSVDDLARIVGARLAQVDGDSRVANEIATEFRDAGIAFAYSPSGPCANCVPGNKCVPGEYQTCQPCCNGCTCATPVDIQCNSLSTAQCKDCCKVLNPTASPSGVVNPMATFEYSNCVNGC